MGFLNRAFDGDDEFTNLSYMSQCCINGNFSEFYKYYRDLLESAPYELSTLYAEIKDIQNGTIYIRKAGDKYHSEVFKFTKMRQRELESLSLAGRGNY